MKAAQTLPEPTTCYELRVSWSRKHSLPYEETSTFSTLAAARSATPRGDAQGLNWYKITLLVAVPVEVFQN